ncbi:MULTISPECIES: pro-sigmaK processing inhibitor BofA family protein [Ruminococcus]|uniref:SigmaK-factor processing regulatory protein BofA n=1 Tax=Ruminococcus flavefaciens TaxID=1265 RepID=A0A1M7H864_RUMFL|nr:MULTISPECIES: pro-sigmaK processing inhibitor BofA family protein [Ruminococcus]MCR4795264.1 pro-sigmaK processing inhibitor BofA family protein [Ruminococcus sp.]SHM24297.1 SigmaK-factor processing regulatory protein BofA [Ruminococcus flavefaciens]
MDTEMIFRSLCCAVIAIMMIYYFRREKKLLSFLTGAVTGGAALFIVNKYGMMIGADIPLNLFNTVGSVVLGVPFVIFLVIMNFL